MVSEYALEGFVLVTFYRTARCRSDQGPLFPCGLRRRADRANKISFL